MESSCKITPKPKSAKEFFTTWYFWKPFLGITIGILLGFLYNFFIESSPGQFEFNRETLNSMFFGFLMGVFLTLSPCTRFGR
jgi:hypothetical protein